MMKTQRAGGISLQSEHVILHSWPGALALPLQLFRQQPWRTQTPFISWGAKRIRAHKVWKHIPKRKIHIAVIDTGLDYSHKDLARAAGAGYNVLHPDSPPHDDNGHGTHIAGTVAANNPESGMTGTAPQTIIHPVKAFDQSGSALISDIVSGIEWCIKNRMDIINMSFGMQRSSPLLREAVRRAARAGIIIVASAGNDGKRRTDYPARYPEVISVGAATRQGKILNISNRGRYIDLYAPGEEVVSTWLNGRYHALSGTSMAASYVSGACALLLAVKPGLTPKQVKQLLKRSQTPVSPAKKQGKTGVGIINVHRAVMRLLNKNHMRSGADTPTRRRTLRRTVRTQKTKARRA